MKKIILAAAFSLGATAAMAGNVAEPVMEPEVIQEDTSSSSTGLIVPIIVLLAVYAATRR